MEDKLTFNLTYRYCDDRDYRLYACGIPTLDELRFLVCELVSLAGIEDIRITYDSCETDYKKFCV